MIDKNQTIKEVELENDELYILNQDLEWLSDGALYSIAKGIADGSMQISELRRYDQWPVVLQWVKRQVATVEVINTFEEAGLTLTDDQVKALNQAIWATDVDRPGLANDSLKEFFSSETEERIVKLDLSKWGYRLLSKWYWMINRPALQKVAEDSPLRLLLSKVKHQLFSREPLVGEQEILDEIRADVEAIGSLMKRIGASTWSEEELPEGQQAA